MSTRTLKGWIEKSFRVLGAKDNPFLIYDLQALGKLECSLSQEWELMRYDLDNPENISEFDNHSSLSRLWVIAGYEFLREINKNDKRSEVNEAHELFRRVRVPMVKFQPADDRNGISYPNDFGTAYLGLSQDTQDVGWAVAPDVFISRNQLADALYKIY